MYVCFGNKFQRRFKLYEINMTHITAINRSLKISNSEGTVVKAKVGHFPLLGNLHWTRRFLIILNELVSKIQKFLILDNFQVF